MFEDVTSIEELLLLRWIEPTDAEYPWRCCRCGAESSIYRPLNTPAVLLLDAAVMIHRDDSPNCSAFDMDVLPAVPFGPQPQEAA